MKCHDNLIEMGSSLSTMLLSATIISSLLSSYYSAIQTITAAERIGAIQGTTVKPKMTVRGWLSWSPISIWSPVKSMIISVIISLIIYVWFPIQSPIWSLVKSMMVSVIISMIVPVVVSEIISLIIAIQSPVYSMINFVTISIDNSMVWTPTSLKPRILALLFRKPWPKIEGLYVHLLSNVAPLACYINGLTDDGSLDFSLWISPSSACVTSTCCLGFPNNDTLRTYLLFHWRSTAASYSWWVHERSWISACHWPEGRRKAPIIKAKPSQSQTQMTSVRTVTRMATLLGEGRWKEGQGPRPKKVNNFLKLPLLCKGYTYISIDYKSQRTLIRYI